MDTLAMRIRRARARAGMTQIVFARALGVTRSAVVQWEHAQTTPTLENLRKIADLTSVDTQWLIGDDFEGAISRLATKVPDQRETVVRPSPLATSRLAHRFWAATVFEVTRAEPDLELCFQAEVHVADQQIPVAYLSRTRAVEFCEEVNGQLPDLVTLAGRLLVVDKMATRRVDKRIIVWSKDPTQFSLSDVVIQDLARMGVSIYVVGSPDEAAAVLLEKDSNA